MKPPDPNESDDPVAKAAANMNRAELRPDEVVAAVKAVKLTRWLDMAIVMHRMGATDSAEFQRLGIWLQRMRRAVG